MPFSSLFLSLPSSCPPIPKQGGEFPRCNEWLCDVIWRENIKPPRLLFLPFSLLCLLVFNFSLSSRSSRKTQKRDKFSREKQTPPLSSLLLPRSGALAEQLRLRRVTVPALGSLLVYLYGITDLLFFLVQMGPAAFFKYSNSRAFRRRDGSKEHGRRQWVKQVGRIQMQGHFIFGVALFLPCGPHVPFELVISLKVKGRNPASQRNLSIKIAVAS